MPPSDEPATSCAPCLCPRATPAKCGNPRPDAKLKIVVEITDAGASRLIHGTLLEKKTEEPYTCTQTPVTVQSSQSTKMFEGKTEDVHGSAVVHVTGTRGTGGKIEAEPIVIPTEYVKVSLGRDGRFPDQHQWLDCRQPHRPGSRAALCLPSRLVEQVAARRAIFQQPYLARMWPHYWRGYLLLVLGAVHSALPMRQGGLRGQNMTGIWLGTLGLAALLLQTVLGLYLQDTALSERRTMRSWHYWLMFLVVLTVSMHVWLNG